MPGFSPSALARTSARHPWRVIALWVVLLAAAIGLIGTIGITTTTRFDFATEPDSVAGQNLLIDAGLADADPTDEIVLVHAESMSIEDPAFRQRVEDLVATLRGMDGVVITESVVNYYELAADPAMAPMAAGLVSEDADAVMIPLTLAGTWDSAGENAPAYLDAVEEFAGDGFDVYSVGFISIGAESNHLAEEDLVRGETFGVGAAMLILIVVFGALVAAGVPVLLAIVSITISFGITAIISQVWDLSFFITNMITMIGLAVGIDYALFVVERFREERRNGRSVLDAITVTGGTASKSVAFSGATVVLALMGMFLLPATLFRAIAAGAIIVVIVSVLATMTLVPAVISVLGDRIDWPRRRRSTGPSHTGLDAVYTGFWGRLTRTVMARPIVSAVAAAGLLIALSIPYWDIEAGYAGAEALPESSAARQGFELLDAEFSAGSISPIQFAIEGDPEEIAPVLDALSASLSTTTLTSEDGPIPAFLPVVDETWVTWSESGDVALAQATLTIPANIDRAYDMIDHLRDDVVPAAVGDHDVTVYVSGETAFNQDFFTMVETYTPIVVGFVLLLSFVLLLVAFRSLVVAAKAILMNLLSVGAAYGLLVLVFQKGVGHEMFGFQQTPTIEAWLPLFLFCVLFGLSMDYHVFLLSRIREHYDLTGRNRESVAVGLHSTARIITGAALIMVAVFAGFASGRLVMLQQMGFGLGVAVLIDATIVRSILVPSMMALLGDRNWYMPRWMAWLPDLRVEGVPTPLPASLPVSGGEEAVEAAQGD